MKKQIHYLINIFFWLFTLLFLIYIFQSHPILVNRNNILMLLISFFLIHLFKFVRQYLLLMESNIPIWQFFYMYVLSTFCSIILPYKIGEIYRMYLYGSKMHNYGKGFLVVLVDKFFDALLLLCIFIPYELANHIALSSITWILLAFALVLIVAYLSFEQTYYYLNRHFMIYSNSKRTIYVLNFFEKCNDIYQYIKNMLKRREVLLLLFTIGSWCLEIIFISYLKSGKIVTYINSVFFGTQNDVWKSYIVIAIMYFVVIGIISLFRREMKRK